MLSSTINLPRSIGLPLSSAILSKVSNAESLWPDAALNLADSGSQVEAAMTNIRLGKELKASNHLQPPLVITRPANKTSKQAPKAQKQSIRITHLALCSVGKNSANNVTDWGTQPILNPTKNRRKRIHP